MIPDLPDVAGRSLSGTTYRISRTENELVCTSVGMTPAADGSAHPIYFYVATQVGMGETVGGLCAICNFDVKDGPLLGGCHVDFAESLRVETDYQVTGEILSLTRKASKKLGVIDLLEYSLALRVGDRTIAQVRNSWILPRGVGK